MKYRIAFFLFDCLAAVLLGASRHLQILGGPFKGMSYHSRSVGSSLTPKILGSYESELYRFINKLPRFSLGIDVGAAEGYYAVGLLKSNFCERIIAWETSNYGRKLLARLADLNGVADSLDIRGACSPVRLADELQIRVGTPTLIVVDCEGFEGPLLEDLDAQYLAVCTLIIETHDMMNPGVHARLLHKFGKTHSVVEVAPAKRDISDLPKTLPLLLRMLRFPGIRRAAMSERRCPDIRWLLCTPLASD